MAEVVDWLRSQIVAEKEAAEAAGAPRLVKVSVKDENGYRWDKKPVEYSGEWRVGGDGDAVEPVCPEAEAVVSASCGCCCSSSEGLDADLKHIAIHDPRDTIARCEADLAILDEHEIHDSGFGQSCTVCFEEGRDGADVPVEAPCRTVRLLAYGRRHRPGWNPDWAPEGMEP